MSVVDTATPITAESCDAMIRKLTETYPFLRTEVLTTTQLGKPLRTLVMGTGSRKVLYSAAHHANEWLTALLLLKFCEDWAEAFRLGGTIGGLDAQALAAAVTVYMVPMVDPDGVDLVVGALSPEETKEAEAIAEFFPDIPFPDGWKANFSGVDLNLQYPAGWLQAREIKFLQGYTRPAPRDFVGQYPLSQAESRGLAAYTETVDPALVIALHSQGKEIYWKFGDPVIPGSRELGQQMADASGYRLADTPYASGFAGYKDWFLLRFRRPGYTVEVGEGVNPLPLSQFPEIYAACLPILLLGATGGNP